ncbi:MAG: amidohydrolase family protein [Bacteroidetes bacterium]|nr:amidohydrolase family protein [Bacteroidota bacterium]
MILRNLHSITEDKVIDIHIDGGKISAVRDRGAIPDNSKALNFDNALVFPGLINSHDHLDFNLFPQLGNRVYSNYVEWSHDIQKENRAEIDKVLKIPKDLRVKWGVYKNLLCGVTTVVNHGTTLSVPDDLINVFQQCYSLHSILLEKHWKRRLLKPFRNSWPFAIHIGEGTDDKTRKEIDTFIKWNLLKRKTIGIHGVAMNAKQAEAFSALVWCPDSNYFLLGKTADIAALKKNTRILFGTDSTVSAGWNIWEHLRAARKEKALSDDELFNALTTEAAAIWGLGRKGRIETGYEADIVIAKRQPGKNTMDAFYTTEPADILAVTKGGVIKLFDASLREQLNVEGMDLSNYHKIMIEGCEKYVWGDLPKLITEVTQYNPEVVFPVE